MNENLFTELSAWMTHAGLAGIPETDIVSVFCDRCVAAGISLGRAHVFIDTLHPVYEGRLFRWGYSPNESCPSRKSYPASLPSREVSRNTLLALIITKTQHLCDGVWGYRTELKRLIHICLWR